MTYRKNENARKCAAKSIILFIIAGLMCIGAVNAQESGLLINPETYYEIFPRGETLKLVTDGATQPAENSDDLPGILFSEGPCWLNGKLYFSSLNFQRDATNSSTIEMDPDGTYRYIQFGKMRTNGIVPAGNGNLLVCDMFGHRIIEMAPDGTVVKVLADKMNDGSRLDGPNDLANDAKGGIYFTDPQYIPGLEKMQKGRAVNYIRPDGEVIRVLEVGEIAFPNGILLSPDGKTVYVCNSQHNAENMSFAENFVMAYDVMDDGTLQNGRRFAQMILETREVRSGNKSVGADGMTIDELGNIYVTSNIGLQIFDSGGNLVGVLKLPRKAINCCFGGDDFKTLYLTCFDKIYSIRTNVRGLEYPLK
ncbi:SMP-30/gluconolactonase/LRE family protein [Candidatus Latescibacterota bacterium]